MIAFRADLSELVRAHGRDSEVVGKFRSLFLRVVRCMGAPHLAVSWSTHLGSLADLIYFLATTGRGLQTLGEEYVGLVQVNDSRKVPSFPQRLTMLLLQVYGYHVTLRMVNFLTRSYLRRTNTPGIATMINTESIKSIAQLIQHAHMAIFFIHGSYYHIGKRLLNIRYLTLRSDSQLSAAKWFRYLGYLMLFQLLLVLWQFQRTLATKSKREQQARRKSSPTPDTESTLSTDLAARHCILCLEMKQALAATPCGHVFCWTCIFEQANVAGTCPVCRMELKASRIVPLFNL